MGALVCSHRVNDCFDTVDLLLVNFIRMLLQSREWTDAGQHAHQALQRSHLADLPQLIAKILERESISGQSASGDFVGLLLVDRLLGALDQRQNVAHAENARHNAVRVERLERVVLLTYADELDGRSRDLTDGESS